MGEPRWMQNTWKSTQFGRDLGSGRHWVPSASHTIISDLCVSIAGRQR